MLAACGGDGGDGSSGERTTTTEPARYNAVATGSVEIAAPSFSGTIALAQDPANPSEASPSEDNIRVQLIDPASPPNARRTMSIGGAIRVGSARPTAAGSLVASYIGDGVILTSVGGECSVTVDRLDGNGGSGRVECNDVPAGGAPLTLKATFELTRAPSGSSTSTAPPATTVP